MENKASHRRKLEMFAKSLVVFTLVGIIAGLGFGTYLLNAKDTTQLVFVEGPSLSIVTEKNDFKKGETINIRIVNSGSVPIIFSDSSYGLKIAGLSGLLIYSPTSSQVISELKPHEEVDFVWDQTKNDGDMALEGLYKISSKGKLEDGKAIEKSVTINIWK